MTNPIDLMKGHIIQPEIVPDGHGKLVKRQVLYFRADVVIAILKERNEELLHISEQVAALVQRLRRDHGQHDSD